MFFRPRKQAVNRSMHRSLFMEPIEPRRMLAVLTVNTNQDIVDRNDQWTSLREAVDIANSLAGTDEIVFDLGHDGPAIIRLRRALRLTDTVTITGPGPELLTIDAQQRSRIFDITAREGDFTINGMKLTNGGTPGADGYSDDNTFGGAAIRSLSSGTLSIADSVVTNSSTMGNGGGVFAIGTLVVNNSTFSGNSAWNGGGIAIADGEATVSASIISENTARNRGGGLSSNGRMTIDSSLISTNSAALGGGVFSGNYAAGNLTVRSSTISGNSARFNGAIRAYGGLTIDSSTISGNSAASNGGIWALGGVKSIRNSIVAGNQGSEIDAEFFGGTWAVRHSLIGDKGDTPFVEAPLGSPDRNGNLIGGPAGGAIDPRLGPLSDNGGLTFTHALLPDSSAIDAGDPSAKPGVNYLKQFDQRGEPYSRVVAGRIDMGAHERQGLTADLTTLDSPAMAPVDAMTIEFTDPVSGFGLSDLSLSRNGKAILFTDDQLLSTTDNQTFVLSGLTNVTSAPGYYTLTLTVSGSEIRSLDGVALDAGQTTSWVMELETLELTVDTLIDESDGRIDDGDISLRDALAAAAPGATISFDTSLSSGTLLLTLGELLVVRAVTVDATALPNGLVIDASGSDRTPDLDDGLGSRLFRIDDTAAGVDSPVVLRGLTLTGGDVHSHGGAIWTAETLLIDRSYVSGNSATDDGGGIYSSGNLTITSSTISGNTAKLSDGGGILSSGELTVSSSTISGNSGLHGGGIRARGRATVTSSTISGNTASWRGGGVFASDEVTVRSSTISGNTAVDSGGGFTFYGRATIESSTIVGNSAGARGGGIVVSSLGLPLPGQLSMSHTIVAVNSGGDLDAGFSEDLLAVRHSLIGTNRDTPLTEAPLGSPDANGNLIGGPVGDVIDPRLGSLTDNGGPAFTHALRPDSPAIDAGAPSATPGVDGVPRFDQRGESYARVAGDRIDVGAHERQDLTATMGSIPSPALTPVDAVTIEFSKSVRGFDLSDVRLSRYDEGIPFSQEQRLTSNDNQTFVLTGLAKLTDVSGYYTLTLMVSGADIRATDGGPLDAGTSVSWAMGREALELTVDTLVDEVDGRIDDGDISLRDALAFAAPGATIAFAPSLSGRTLSLTKGELLVDRAVTLDATALTHRLTIDASGKRSRIFHIDDGSPFVDSPVTLRGLALTGGNVVSDGGAVLSQESLLIEECSIMGNFGAAGGGISGSGNVTVRSSTISGNFASGDGGGIKAAGNVTIHSSSISENEARFGGGIKSFGNVTVHSSTIARNLGMDGGGGISASGKVEVHSSTISGNATVPFFFPYMIIQRHGGGIVAQDVTVASSTIFGNSALEAGGIRAFGDISIVDSIVAANVSKDETGSRTRASDLFVGSLGTVTVSHSLIGDSSGSNLPEAPPGSPDANGNLIGGPMNGAIDPRLAPLRNNGGPTLTHALLPDSPAINMGDPSAVIDTRDIPPFDQRGEPYARAMDGRIDMGAFESRPVGDSNGDGVFDSLDLVMVLQAGKYEDDVANNTTFEEGDWNGDGDFDRYDVVFALQAGNYIA